MYAIIRRSTEVATGVVYAQTEADAVKRKTLLEAEQEGSEWLIYQATNTAIYITPKYPTQPF